ncbi:MAG: histidinol-phosphatase [Bacillota bacterium]
MIPKVNFHTHTLFCDGKNSAEEMVLSAIEKGFTTLGFSGHSYTDFDLDFCMKKEDVASYINEINSLKEKYRDEITIFTGVEQDIFSGKIGNEFDYGIGSVHYIKKEGQYLCVDWSEEISKSHIEKFFGGDAYAYAEAYYETVTDVLEVTGADIIGHFDLVAKFNEHGALFDTTHPRYKKAVSKALDQLLPYGKPFEINTGAIFRGLRTEPYPSLAILEEIHQKGGEVVLSSDSHDTSSIGFYFAETMELIKKIGFSHCVLWSLKTKT